jgi:glycosyltransferase involved in cell wall biosynthesis
MQASGRGHAPVIGVSDVSLGYGSPEVPAIFALVCEAAGAHGLLLEPDEADRPDVDRLGHPQFAVERVRSGLPSGTTAWRREFLRAAMLRIEAARPDALVIFGGASFLLRAALKHRPRRIIYHAYEQICDLPPDDQEAHRAFLPDADLVIAPEPHRLAHDCTRLGVWPRRWAGVLNSADVAFPGPILRRPPGARNGRFLWSGALDRRRTFAHWLWSPALSEFGIDLYGRISDPDPAAVEAAIAACPNLDRKGLVAAADMNRARAAYAFSLAWWNPANSFGHLHLCSNRFFTSICAGVPPICGPHPQCVAIARRHDCAIVMDDWTEEALARAMARAMSIYGSDRYDRMVANCVEAAETALGWPRQADALRPALAEALA